MKTIMNWSAKRAGASITISGTYVHNEPVKVVGVTGIRSGHPYPVATDKNGVQYALA